jgi:bifunctional diaminopimelate decarboxylase / aspartate kinase
MLQMHTKCSWIVAKFGGTSVSSKENCLKIKDAIVSYQKQGYRVLVVCSALAKVSNHLDSLSKGSAVGFDQASFDALLVQHSLFAKTLGVEGCCRDFIEAEFSHIKSLCLGVASLGKCTPEVYASIMSKGERLLTYILSSWLLKFKVKHRQIDARDFLIVKSEATTTRSCQYIQSFCSVEEDVAFRDFCEQDDTRLILTQGFIASNASGETVLLGRGGSDTSAAYFAVKLAAKRVDIWTDVPGVFSSNPHKIPQAKLLKYLDYEEAQELAALGAKVLHPQCIAPLQENSIECNIRWTANANVIGTQIGSDYKQNNAAALVKAVLAKTGIYLISMETVSMWQQAGFLAKVFACFATHNIAVDHIATSQTNITVSLDVSQPFPNEDLIDLLLKDLNKFCKAKHLGPYAAISLVGKKIRSIVHKIGEQLEAFEEKKIYLISHSASDLNFTFIISEAEVEKTVQSLHERFFSTYQIQDGLGATWQEFLAEERKTADKKNEAWWYEKKKQLLKQASIHTPCYVYDLDEIKKSIAAIKTIGADRIHYAVKANDNERILQTIASSGLGFDCVSIEEVVHVQKILGRNANISIGFTPNFVSIDEYKKAIQLGCEITIDNVSLLREYPKFFSQKSIHIRLDPSIRAGHHRFVRTAGNQSKFGISIDDMGVLKEITTQHAIKVKGLHAHIGSGIRDASLWAKTAENLIKIAKDLFPLASVINIGGGFGLQETKEQSPLDLKVLKKQLKDIKKQAGNYDIWIEPGRYIVAKSGVLLTKITQIKHKSNKCYIGVDVGMNSFMRPAFYGSYHNIVNLSALEAGRGKYIKADIVGPICESSDVFGRDRLLAESKIGDVVLLDCVGAYGRVMASLYNRRRPAKEVILT